MFKTGGDQMISFKEFLSSQEGRLRAEQIAQDQVNRKWIAAVDSLFKQVEEWIKEFDPHGLVRLDGGLLGDIDEQGNLRNVDDLGRLDISLGDQHTRLRPAVHEGLGPRWKPGNGTWAGRVDMLGNPNGYELYRFLHSDDREEWYLRSTRDYQMKRLDRSSFDAALVDLFS